MAEIDALSIEIKASAGSATRSLDNLIKKVNALGTAVSGNTGKIGQLANNMRTLSNSMQGFNSINASKFTMISKGVEKLNGINASNLATVGDAIRSMSSSLGSLDHVNVDFEGISNLSKSLGKLGSKGVSGATQNLESLKTSLSQFVQSMNSIGSITFDVAGLTNLTQSLAHLGRKNVTNATFNVPRLAAGLKELSASIGTLSFEAKGLSDFASAISKLGGVSSGRAVENIPRLGEALKKMYQTLSTSPRISKDIIQMTQALAQLASSLGNVNRASNTTAKTNSLLARSFRALKDHARNTSHHFKGLASQFGMFYAKFWLLLRAFRAIGKAIDLSSDLTEVQNVVDVTFGNMSSKIEKFSKNSMKYFGMTELSAKQFGSRFQAMGVNMGISSSMVENVSKGLPKLEKGYIKAGKSVADMSVNLTALTADMASFYNVSQEDVAKDLESIYTGQTRPLRQYGLDLTEATLKEWAMKNGLDSNIKSMTQAEKTLLRYRYVMSNSTVAMGDFARTSDRSRCVA